MTLEGFNHSSFHRGYGTNILARYKCMESVQNRKGIHKRWVNTTLNLSLYNGHLNLFKQILGYTQEVGYHQVDYRPSY